MTKPCLPISRILVADRFPVVRVGRLNRDPDLEGIGALVLRGVTRMPVSSLEGCIILIFQRSWAIARDLAKGLEAEGARVLLATALPEHAQPSAAILDSHRPELCQELKAKGVPFLLYTGSVLVHEACAGVPIVRKPASRAVVVEAVKGLLN